MSLILMLLAAWAFGCASGICLALHADTRAKRAAHPGSTEQAPS